jgi:hypothetical protein
MSYPNPISAEEFKIFKDDIFSELYAV